MANEIQDQAQTVHMTSEDAYISDNSFWMKQPFGYKLGSSFTKMINAAEWSALTDKEMFTENDWALMQELLSKEVLPEYIFENPVIDTSLGGSNVINPYWQFCENDDIIHPMHTVGYEHDTGNPYGLGRCYAENIERNQQILYLQFGVTEWNNLKDFYLDSYNPDTAQLMKEGSSSILHKLGVIVGTVGKMAFFIPWLPFYVLGKIIDVASSRKTYISKYCDFKAAMPLYYSLANALLAHFAVNLGLYANADEESFTTSFVEARDSNIFDKVANTLNKLVSSKTYSTKAVNGVGEQVSEVKLHQKSNYDYKTIPRCLRYGGLDIYRILSTRMSRLLAKKKSFSNIDNKFTLTQLIERNKAKEENSDAEDSFIKTFMGSGLGADDFIGIKIERSTTFSESVSNSTGPSSIASQLNSRATEMNDTRFITMDFNTGIPGLDELVSGAKDFFSGVANGLNISGGLGAIMGTAHFDIPDMWQDSNFVKNYSFSIRLRAPVCDTVSYFQCICYPLALLLAGAFPRGVGNNTYTSPMFVRAFCKGMFSVQYGIIDSMTIRRGSAEYGWTNNQLPNAIDIDLNIKDLSPAMFLSILGDDEKLKNTFSSNTSMQDYLLTLTGVSLADRYYFTDNLKRKAKLLAKLTKDTWLNPMYHAYTFGSSNLARAIFAVTPTKILQNIGG